MSQDEKGASPKRTKPEEYMDAIVIFLYRAETPSCTTKEIAKGIDVHYNTIPRYLDLVLKMKLVKLQVAGTTNLYYLTDKGRNRVEELLAKTSDQ